MTDPPPSAGSDGTGGDRGPTPRWVKVAAITVVVLVLLAIAVILISGGEHGPGRHLPSGDGAHRTALVAGAARHMGGP
ncbi:hypothetical protein HS041_28695 [Planomonospora sp. ID67723]|uniref:hypothetical protein n=1 Tax=Planomonospora sp. ID67723 TaxID=2738134 RepID=UPI0018C4031C|nr:hypothetical protein [Planomonospora sp. ID67723]MBG0831710.1 hypothetical protein [Planomonospora sp. ID67723]